MKKASRKRSVRSQSGKRQRSFVLKRSKPLARLDTKKEEENWFKRGMACFKRKIACCAKKGTGPQGMEKKSNAPMGISTRLQQANSNGLKPDYEKIKPKSPGDLRKTLVIEVNHLLVHFRSKKFNHTPIELVESNTLQESQSSGKNPNKNPSKLPKGEMVEVEPVFRNDLANFFRQLQDFYEVILWTNMPKKVMEGIVREIDVDCKISIVLYADKCKLFHPDPKSKTPILTKDLSILKRPISSIVLLDVNPMSAVDYMANTYLMQPFLGNSWDAPLGELVLPLQALSNMKDVRNVTQNIADYHYNIEKLEQFEQEPMTPYTPASPFIKKLNQDLNRGDFGINCFETTRRTLRQEAPDVKLDRETKPQNDVPEDEEDNPYADMKQLECKPNCLSKLHLRQAKLLPLQEDGLEVSRYKEVERLSSFHGNLASIDRAVKSDRSLRPPATMGYLQPVDEEKQGFSQIAMRNKLSYNGEPLEAKSGGDELIRRSQKSRVSSGNSSKQPGFEGFSATLKKLRLQSYNEVDELFIRMNSTARKLMQ